MIMNTPNISNLKTITDISFFDFMRCFFCDPKKYAQITKKAKEKQIFMFYRTMSIMYPVQMHAINGIHDIRLIDQLHKNFGKQGAPYPRWLYTKSEKEKTEKEKLDFSEDIIQKFISVYDLEPKSFDFLLSIDKQFVIDELTRIKTEMSNEYKKVKTDKANKVK